MNTEYEGSLQLLALNLQKQDLHLQEKLAERELILRRQKRIIKEQILKGSLKASIPQQPIIKPHLVQNEITANKEMEAVNLLNRSNSKLQGLIIINYISRCGKKIKKRRK